MHNLCPPQWMWMMLMTSPSFLNTLTVVILVPVLHYVLIPYCTKLVPDMLTRLGFGMFVTLLQQVAGIMIAWGMWDNTSMHGCNGKHLVAKGELLHCFLFRFKIDVNGTCQNFHYRRIYYCIVMAVLPFSGCLFPIFFEACLTCWYL